MEAAVNSLRIVLAAEQSINEKRVVELGWRCARGGF